ncbi:MAG: Ig-like domain-containing protein [Ignisphaera sp.]
MTTNSNNNSNNAPTPPPPVTDITIPLPPLEEGEHTIVFYAIDPVGNNVSSSSSSLKPVKFFLKKIVPQLSIGQPSFIAEDKRVYITSATPLTIGIDATTGYLVQYAIDDTSNSNNIITSTTNSITFSLARELSDGLHTIWYRAVRLTDNKATIWYKQEVYLDNTPPTSSINIKDNAILTENDVITITASDEGSGVAKIFYRIDNGEWVEVDVATTTTSSSR